MSLFSKENIFHFAKELIWWAITLMIAFAVVYPIYQKIDYMFLKMNMFFVFLAITYFRWTVSIRNLPFLQPVWTRFALFALNVSLFVYLMGEEQKFLMRIDNFFVEDFGMAWKELSMVEAEKLMRYIYTEIVLFGTGALIMIFLFNARIIISAWQFYKYKADKAFVNN
jgi:hypothetical protein